jgi:hypothetical protein
MPSETNLFAVAKPIPVDPPVMTAVFPVNLFAMALSFAVSTDVKGSIPIRIQKTAQGDNIYSQLE